MAIKTVEANGLTFGYLDDGDPDAPLALCLHGFPDSAHTWRHLLPALAAEGFHAVAPFTRGYAPTDVPADGAYQTGALVSDANALHEALGGGSDAVLIGHDWGAFTAYGALAHAPDRWRRGVTMAVPPAAALATGFFSYPQQKRSFYIFLFQTALAGPVLAHEGMSLLDGLWADWSPGYDATEDLAQVKTALAGESNQAAAIGYYRAMLGTDPAQPQYAAEQAATQGAPPQPVLYLHGSTDGCLGVELVEGVEAFLAPGSETVILDGVGHFLHLEAPVEVEKQVLRWLSD